MPYCIVTSLSHGNQRKLWFYHPHFIDEKMEAHGLMLKFTRVVSVRARRGAWGGDRACALDHRTSLSLVENAGATPCPGAPVVQQGSLPLTSLPDIALPERPAPLLEVVVSGTGILGPETAADGEGPI